MRAPDHPWSWLMSNFPCLPHCRFLSCARSNGVCQSANSHSFQFMKWNLCWMAVPLKTLACTSLLQVPSACMLDCFNQSSISQVTEKASMHITAVCLQWLFSRFFSMASFSGTRGVIFVGLFLCFTLFSLLWCATMPRDIWRRGYFLSSQEQGL